MSATGDPLTVFGDSLDRLEVEYRAVAPEEATDAIAAAVDPPAVGVRLPFEGVSLPDSVQVDPTPADLRAATTGVTAATLAVADYGSILLESDPEGTEAVSLFPDRHVAVLDSRDVVPDMRTAFAELGPKLREGASGVLATGPSATADMGELVRGAHGPETVEVVVLDE
jgi:L-lactate dehydrogenase complex protein LldG